MLWSGRLLAGALLLRRGIKPREYLGTTGGDHVYRDALGRVWSVDLVLGSCTLNVGEPPSRWEHPPQLELN